MAADVLTDTAFQLAANAGVEVLAVVTQGSRVVAKVPDVDALEAIAFSLSGRLEVGVGTSTVEHRLPDGGQVRFWATRTRVTS